MTLSQRKSAFVKLGQFLKQFSFSPAMEQQDIEDIGFHSRFEELIQLSQSHNGWYTPENVRFAISSWAEALSVQNLDKWLEGYQFAEISPKTVALILAGNIPLVGFHDFLCVLISGHKALVKTSSNDQHLLPFLAKYLIHIEPGFSDRIEFTKEKLEGFDAVIATGSNNTARYFDYYFRDKPSIIRKNRNSVAILTGHESKQELISLGQDIFRYFGLGCRNVSKLFVPPDYNFDALFEALFEYREIIEYEKYANNYDYNKAVFLMSNFKLLDNGFVTLKQDESHASPISSIFYEYYDDAKTLRSRLQDDADKIQCVVANGNFEGAVGFGATQKPELWDYADNVDTIEFLLQLR